MNLELIKTYVELRRIPFKTLAASIGMSEGNLHRCVRENKIQASDLEKIAIKLEVPIGEFFDEAPCVHVEAHDHSQAAGRDINNGSNKDELIRLKEKISHLEQRIRDKDDTIAEKDKRIADKDELIKILRGA